MFVCLQCERDSLSIVYEKKMHPGDELPFARTRVLTVAACVYGGVPIMLVFCSRWPATSQTYRWRFLVRVALNQVRGEPGTT